MAALSLPEVAAPCPVEIFEFPDATAPRPLAALSFPDVAAPCPVASFEFPEATAPRPLALLSLPDVAAAHAQPQVQPLPAGAQAVLAAVARGDDVLDGVQVRAVLSHGRPVVRAVSRSR
jgi:hypothetical protein